MGFLKRCCGAMCLVLCIMLAQGSDESCDASLPGSCAGMDQTELLQRQVDVAISLNGAGETPQPGSDEECENIEIESACSDAGCSWTGDYCVEDAEDKGAAENDLTISMLEGDEEDEEEENEKNHDEEGEAAGHEDELELSNVLALEEGGAALEGSDMQEEDASDATMVTEDDLGAVQEGATGQRCGRRRAHRRRRWASFHRRRQVQTIHRRRRGSHRRRETWTKHAPPEAFGPSGPCLTGNMRLKDWKASQVKLAKGANDTLLFRCNTNDGFCVDVFTRCNGIKNCRDNSDETGCTTMNRFHQQCQTHCKDDGEGPCDWCGKHYTKGLHLKGKGTFLPQYCCAKDSVYPKGHKCDGAQYSHDVKGHHCVVSMAETPKPPCEDRSKKYCPGWVKKSGCSKLSLWCAASCGLCVPGHADCIKNWCPGPSCESCGGNKTTPETTTTTSTTTSIRPAGGSVPWYFSTSSRAAIVKKHNDLRAGMGASDMMEMKWDDKLALASQLHVAGCPKAHSTNRGSTVGENMAGKWASGASFSANTDFTSSVQAWYDEIKDSGSYKTGGTFKGFGSCTGVCGHYTQVVWAAADKIGCGAAYCPHSSGMPGYMFVCQYGSSVSGGYGGNMEGKTLFTKGKACSKCPSGSSCSKGLCA